MLKLICFLLSIIYLSIMFLHCSSIFLTSVKTKKSIYLASFLNIFLVSVILKSNIIIPEFLFATIWPIILCIEIKLIFKDTWVKNILATTSLALNFFAIRLIVLACFCIKSHMPIFLAIQDYNIILIINSIALFINIIYVLIFFIFSPIKWLNMIITDKENLKFSLNIISPIYCFVVFCSWFLYVQIDKTIISFYILKIAICAIIVFFSALIYSYRFSKLQLYVVKAENIEKEVKENEIALKKLEDEANYDYFTSCLKRDVIHNKIECILKKGNPFFCVAFIDIDGLKTTNDVYGHDEGDFYIKTVAEILNEEFVGKSIGRLGGDEFLVVLDYTDIYATMKCVIRCYEKTKNISKDFKKPYKTSISYGVVEITPDNKMTKDEIIKLADNNMYAFKKSRKKNRK